jgi:hypothetical protein
VNSPSRPTPTRVIALFGFGYEPDVRLRKTTQSLAGAGFDVTVVAWDRSGELPRRERDGAVAIERVRVRSRRGRGLGQIFFLGRAGLAMMRRLRRHRPDVVHAVDLPMLLVAVLARPFVGRPKIVYDAFEIYSLMVAHRFPRPVLGVLRLLERRLPRAAQLVIVAGISRRTWFEHEGIASIVVPNWVAAPEGPGPDQAARTAARASFGVESGQFCLVYAGALLASRDLESLLRYAGRHPADAILIAGTGDREAWLATAVEGLPNVRLLGWLPDPAGVMLSADALFYALHTDHPYAAYAAPNTLYVAIAAAVPLVFRAQGELGLLGAQHDIGRTFTDDASLDAATAELRDPVVAERVRQSMRALRAGYSWDAAVAPLLAAYPRIDRPMNSANANGP